MELNKKNEVKKTEKNSKEEMNEMINQSLEKFKKVKRGDIIKGQIMKVDEDGYLVDIKYKMEGYLPKSEKSLFSKEEGDVTHTLEIGDEVYLFVANVDNKNGNIILSREKAKYFQLWEKLNEIFRKKEKISAEVIEKNPAGLIVNIGMKGFVPKSQIETKFIKDEDLDKYIGKKLDLIIIKLEKKDNKVILSHRIILEKERKIMHKKTLADLAVGQETEGIITNITKFGAFVDIGGVEGLLHISEITWRDMKDATKLLKVGDKIKVKIIDYNKENKKISLSIKQFSPDPWKNVKEKYSIGDENFRDRSRKKENFFRFKAVIS